MPEVRRTDELHRCPKCKRNVKPHVLEEIPAMTRATPPIPKRQRVRCSAIKCRHMWYVVIPEMVEPVNPHGYNEVGDY